MTFRAFLIATVASVLAFGGPVAAVADELPIGYLQLKKDKRYGKRRTFARYLMQPIGRPYTGAQVALDEVKFHTAAVGVEFRLDRRTGDDVQDLVTTVEQMSDAGTRFFLVDAPAEAVAALAAATSGRGLLLFNISARDDDLRQESCQAHLLHTIPSYAMLVDALTQYLVSKKWRDVLILEGPLPADEKLTAAFVRSAKRFGLKIVDRRPFVLSNDPRERDKNNVALLTTGRYDVVFVADTDGEFARDVPYQTVLPRPVVGTEGLAAAAWHWSWDRHGAPQLENRFQRKAKRPMKSEDWAAWMAVKSLAEAVLRTGGTDEPAIARYLVGSDIILDGFKGNRLSFRPWDRQLRQPVLLVTHNWVVERAPLRAFLHPKNNLDTLGYDERDSVCKP